MTLSERDHKTIWHPYTQMQTAEPAIGIVRGEGVYLVAEDGSRYLDMISSWWVNIHGHSNPFIAEKISRQLTTLEHVIFAGFTHEPAVELAEKLLEILPASISRIFYSDNGSTAVEVALKMAIQYWHNKGVKKQKILAFENAYHGDTFGAMSVSGRSVFTDPFRDLLFEVIFVPVPVSGHEDEAMAKFMEVIDAHRDIAAFIFEPLLQGTAGMVMYEAALLNRMIQLAKEKNIIIIADEVMTGFGRTGKIFATDYISNKPDIFCLSKGLTGGFLPMGITACSSEIYEAFLSADKSKTFFHGHSYTANPIACTAAIASLELLLNPGCLDKIKQIESWHSGFMKNIITHPFIKNIRNIGTVMAIELVTTDETSYLNNIRDTAYRYFLDRKILIRPLGNIIYLMPPYCIEKEEMESVYDVILNFLNTYLQ
jgi:adenosylmethionine---8-amino-7-oxononanoate aminotransferase